MNALSCDIVKYFVWIYIYHVTSLHANELFLNVGFVAMGEKRYQREEGVETGDFKHEEDCS